MTDPRIAIENRIKELTEEVKLHERALAVYERLPSVSGEVKGIEDQIFKFLAENDRILGWKAVEIGQRLFIPTNPIITLLRKDKRFIQVNEGGKNQRFRLKELVEEPKETVKRTTTKRKQPTKIAKRGERKEQLHKFLETNLTFTIEVLANTLKINLNHANVLMHQHSDWWTSTNEKARNSKGRSVTVYQSTLYGQPRETVIHAGEGVREGRRLPDPRVLRY